MVSCLTSQKPASLSQERICSDMCTCCHTEIEVVNRSFYLTQSQYTDTGPSFSADPVSPGAWQGSHWSTKFLSHWDDSTRKNPHGASGNRNLEISSWISKAAGEPYFIRPESATGTPVHLTSLPSPFSVFACMMVVHSPGPVPVLTAACKLSITTEKEKESAALRASGRSSGQ